jgi:peptidyl-prolyl cis-trans isomerase SurA
VKLAWSSISLLAAAVLLVAVRAQAAETIERVAAIVNDDAILLSDLRRRAAPFLEAAVEGASPGERKARIKELYDRLLQQLVDEELVEQAAKKGQISVTSMEIEQAIDNVRRQNSLAEDAFWSAVRAQGFTEKQYREDVRKQLLRLKVVNQRVRSRVNITDQTVHDTYDDRVREARRKLKFRASHVFFPLQPSASATDVAKALEQARGVRKGLSVESFDATTQKLGGGDLGWLEQGDLPGVLEEALLGLSEGEISAPVRGPSGLHLFLLRERQSGATAVPTYEEARGEIQRELLDKAMARQEELFIKGLRRDAVVKVLE